MTTAERGLMAGALCLALALGRAGADPADLLWPLDLQPALSSTFGETRATAFHFGIDLKTWGKTGYPVHAVADGWVQRVRTSPWGYGRALYERLADGRIAVYAHLERFCDPVQARVVAAQRATRLYSTQLWFEAGEVAVRRGDVIAWTGQSGAGPPHLHVEIRDADNVPLNPLRQGLGPVADTTPPTLRSLLLTPLSATTTIDGGRDAAAVTLRATADGYEAPAPIRLWGRVGLAVDAYDRADLATNKMAAWRHVLRVDGRPVFTSTFERVSYADGHLVALDRLRPAPDEGVFTALFRRPGNRLPFSAGAGEGEAGDGVLVAGEGGLAGGMHDVEVEVADVAGNRSLARLRLLVGAPPTIMAARLRPAADGDFVEASFADEDDGRLVVEIGAGDEVVERAEVDAAGGPFTWRLPARAGVDAWTVTAHDAAGNRARQSLAVPRPTADPSPFALAVTVTPHARHAVLRVASPWALRQVPQVSGPLAVALTEDAPGVYTGVAALDGVDADSVVLQVSGIAADGATGVGRVALAGRALRVGGAQDLALTPGEVRLQTAAGSAFETVYPQASREPVAATPDEAARLAAAGLAALAPACRIGPGDTAFDERATLLWRVAGAADGVGIYADDGRGRWVLVGADGGDGSVRAGIRAFGRFALLRDAMAPTIAALRPADGATVGAEPTFAAGLADAGSGIAREEDIELWLDEERLVAEYDPEAESVSARADAPLTPGPHRLRVRVRDAAGNLAEAAAAFVSR